MLLADVGEGNALPSEFRLFRRGLNTTSKGDVIFDDAAAESVMAAYAQHGTDVQIDLEHLSLDTESKAYDPDARGWCQLELREGELWAVNVKWTPDGARRLNDRAQRYISPTFFADADGRVASVLNLALTALPATHEPAALIAANRLPKKLNMRPEDIRKAIEALKEENGDAALAILESALVAAAGGEEMEEPDTEEPAASEAEAPSEEPREEELAQQDAVKALRALSVITGTADTDEIVTLAASWAKRIADVEEREQEIELSERRVLVGELVKLGAELPSTAWEGDAKARKPVARLLSEPLDGLKARVNALKGARPAAVKPPTAPSSAVKLSQVDLKAAEAMKITPEEYAARKAAAVRRSVR